MIDQTNEGTKTRNQKYTILQATETQEMQYKEITKHVINPYKPQLLIHQHIEIEMRSPFVLVDDPGDSIDLVSPHGILSGSRALTHFPLSKSSSFSSRVLREPSPLTSAAFTAEELHFDCLLYLCSQGGYLLLALLLLAYMWHGHAIDTRLTGRNRLLTPCARGDAFPLDGQSE